MSVSGVNNPLLGAIAARLDRVAPARTEARELAQRSMARADPALSPDGAARATAADPMHPGLGVEPPEGVDPALWSVLTAAERAFFAQQAAAGPLTYGRMGVQPRSGTAAIPVARGGRLDVRA